MKEQEAYAALIKREPGWLARPIEELVKMSAVGDIYLASHKKLLQKIKNGQIQLAEEDRKTQLKQGQIIGESLLDTEVKIGELLPRVEEMNAIMSGHFHGKRPSEQTKILPEGIDRNKACIARTLARNPEVVERIKAEARENEDIPTKTAVLNRVKYEKEKAYNETSAKKKEENKLGLMMSLEQEAYIGALRRVIEILPTEPPKDWNEKALNLARGYVAIILKRLEVFNGKIVKSDTVGSIGQD